MFKQDMSQDAVRSRMDAANNAVIQRYLVENGLVSREDANASHVLSRELEFVRAGVLTAKRPEVRGRLIVPQDPEQVPTWASSHTWTEAKEFAEVKVIEESSDDIPFVELNGTQNSASVITFAVGYRYTKWELEAAAQTSMKLSMKKPLLARKSMDYAIDKAIMLGVPGMGSAFEGFLNRSEVAAPLSLQNWSTATATQIVTDLNSMYAKISLDTNSILDDGLVLEVPPAVWTAINTVKDFGNGQWKTTLQFIREACPYVTVVGKNFRGKNAGASSRHRSVLYKRDNEVLEYTMVVDLDQPAAMVENDKIKQVMYSRYGGLKIHQPKGIVYGDHLP